MQFTGDGSKEEHVVYVIAIPANRYDLLCMEGFARALRIFLNIDTPPVSNIFGSFLNCKSYCRFFFVTDLQIS